MGGQGGGQRDVDGGAAEDAEHGVAPPQVQARGGRQGQDVRQRLDRAGLRRVKRLEDAGVITGYRAVIDPAAVGHGLEVFVDVDINANDRKAVQEFETTAAAYDEVLQLRRMFGHPDVTSHLTMKKIKEIT